MKSEKQSLARGLAGLMLSAALVLAFGQTAKAQPAKPKQLQVVVVSVSTFDDPAFQSPLLQQGITTATTNLRNFIGARFPSANLTVLSSHDETSNSNLTTFFKATLPSIADGNVTLLFVLSHGQVYQYPNAQYGSDVQIIASDTPQNAVRGKSISLSNDVLHYLTGLSPGTLIFGFIDTCYSGAALNFSVGLDDAVKNKMGVKTMLMASALSDQMMFQAGFTQALVNLWSQPGGTQSCTVPELSPGTIRGEIEKILNNAGANLGQTDGYPTVLIHFQGAFCIESFAADSALVAVYNASPNSYLAVFTDPGGHTFPQTIQANDTTPLRLARGSYQMALFQNNQQASPPKTLDLSAEPVDYEVVGNPNPDPARVGQSLEDTVAAAQAVGISDERLNDLRKRAFVAYVVAKDERHANALAAILDKSGDPGWLEARQLSAKPLSEIRASVRNDDPVALATAANQLASVGSLEGSGQLYWEAAKATVKSDVQRKAYFAKQAYLSLSATGHHNDANTVRQKFKLPAKEVCEGCVDLGKMAAKGNQAASAEIQRISGSQVVVGMAHGTLKASGDAIK